MASDTPHDRIVRHTLSQPAAMASALGAILPPELVAAVDWRTLQRGADTLVDDDGERRADLVFTARTVAGDAVAFVVWFEHQSSHDPSLIFRFLLAFAKSWREAQRSGQPLVPFVPVVLANAPQPWRGPNRLLDALTVDPSLRDALAPYIPDFRLVVDDVTSTDEATLRARPASPVVRVLWWSLRVARLGHAAEELGAWAVLVASTQREDPQAGQHILRYMSKVGRGASAVKALAAHEASKEAVMTLYQELIAKGEQLGLAKGEQLGLAKGEQLGERAGLLTALTVALEARFGALPASTRARIEATPTSSLAALVARAATSATLEDVFSG